MTKVFTDTNPSQIYADALITLLNEGNKCSPRGKDILEVRPVILEYQNPKSRVTFLKGRVINPFFQLAESLWILAGRSDVNWLLDYNKNMKQFSDDGQYFNAPYGERLRYWNKSDANNFVFNPMDQLFDVYKKITADEDTRQAVAVIYNPIFDHANKDTVDRPCLTGDTLISSPEGDILLKDLVQKYQEGIISEYPVYSWNETLDRVEIKKVNDAWLSKKNEKVFKITLTDGTIIKATGNHKFYVRKYEMEHRINSQGKGFALRRFKGLECVEVSQLQQGDTLNKLLKTIDKKGYTTVSQSSLTRRIENQIPEHRFYKEYLLGRKLKDNEIVHHKDADKQNNRELNLQVMSKSEHDAIDMKNNDRQKGFSKKREDKEKLSQEYLYNTAKNTLQLQGDLTWDLFLQAFERVGVRNAVKRHFGSFVNLKEQVYKETGKEIPNYRGGKTSNMKNAYKILSIEECGYEDVYDIEVEDNHNFFANDILTHNCNLILTFKLRDRKLDLTVFNRSNDLHWGVMGANLCQFSTILEVMASWLGVDMGTYYQITDSLHIYTDDYGAKETDKILNAYRKSDEGFNSGFFSVPSVDEYLFEGEPRFSSFFNEFQTELSYIFAILDPMIRDDTTYDVRTGLWLNLKGKIAACPDAYLRLTLNAMVAYQAHKRKCLPIMVDALQSIPDCSWKVSCLRFLSKKYLEYPEFFKLYVHLKGDVVDYIERKGE